MEKQKNRRFYKSDYGQYGYTYNDTDDTASQKILCHSSSSTNGSSGISRTDCYEYDDRSGNITGIFRTENGEEEGYRTDYSYNENGFMTTQTGYKNGEYESTAVYIWDSDTLVERRIYDKNDPESYTSSRIIYDADGEAQALVVTSGKNGIFDDEVGELVLYYRRNLQGDITGLVDSEGKPWGEFIYDAYGNFTFKPESDGITGVLDCMISFVLTPISYRGYVYTSLDSKHCYYYLGSRFYSPLLSRFMNADSIPDTGTGVVGTNMFAYCNNSPVLLTDPNGTRPGEATADGSGENEDKVTGLMGGLVALVVWFVVANVLNKTGAPPLDISWITAKDEPWTGTEILVDKKPIIPRNNRYYIVAYVDTLANKLVKVGKWMDYLQTLTVLGVANATTSLSSRYTCKNKCEAEKQATKAGAQKNKWGIYAKTQYAAKALAVVFGYTDPPKVHGYGYYGHYHDVDHKFHIWFGNPIYKKP